MDQRFAIKLNALALYAISVVLAAALGFQFALHELPCPLCLLQRVAFAALAVGPILTLRHGPRPAHYALAIIAALAGAGIAARQVLIHIAPGDPGYGSAVLGLHLYSWALVIFALAIAASAIMLLFDRQFAPAPAPDPGLIERAAVWLVIGLTVLNAADAFAVCGFAACPANPSEYRFFSPASTG